MKIDKDGKILSLAKTDSMIKLIQYLMKIEEQTSDEKILGLMLSENNFCAFDIFEITRAISTRDRDIFVDFINRTIEEIVYAKEILANQTTDKEWI